jgi:uncharacterized protein
MLGQRSKPPKPFSSAGTEHQPHNVSSILAVTYFLPNMRIVQTSVARRTIGLFAACLLMSACFSGKVAEPTAEQIKDDYSRRYSVESIDLPASNGDRLRGVLIRSNASLGRLPTILIRTPYEIWGTEIAGSTGFIDAFLAAGYVVLIQNERGKELSGGTYTGMMPFARDDGVATLDWIAKQPWSTGKVGTFGCSSSAENQLALAMAQHPAHAAMVPMSAAVAMTSATATGVHESGQSRRGGVFWHNWASWFAEFGTFRRTSHDYAGGDAGRSAPAALPTADVNMSGPEWPERSRGFPQIDALKRLGYNDTEFETYVKRAVVDPEWKHSRISDDDDITVPTLWMTSWFDYSPQIEIGVFEANRRRAQTRGSNDQKMIVGSGMHCSQGTEQAKTLVGDRPVGDARLDYTHRVVSWFDAYVKKDKSALEFVASMPSIFLYDNGARRWESAAKWPVKSDMLELCIGKLGTANVLSQNNCDAAVTAISYHHDPYDPVPTLGGGGYLDDLGKKYPLGSIDQKMNNARKDIHLFMSAALSDDVKIAGNIQTSLWVSADVPDIDLFAKLVEILPSGEVYNVADTAARARYRQGFQTEAFLRPGEQVEMELATMVAWHTFRKGSRIGLQIASSNWPQFSINTGTQMLPEIEKNPQPANIQLWFGKGRNSRIRLPVTQPMPQKLNGASDD